MPGMESDRRLDAPTMAPEADQGAGSVASGWNDGGGGGGGGLNEASFGSESQAVRDEYIANGMKDGALDSGWGGGNDMSNSSLGADSQAARDAYEPPTNNGLGTPGGGDSGG